MANILPILRFAAQDNARINNAFIGISSFVTLTGNVFHNGVRYNISDTAIAVANASLRQQEGGALNVNNFGTLNPGQPLGTLFMDGNFTQGSTGRLNIEIGGTTQGTQHDALRVFNGAASGTGTATLGGTVNVNFVNGFVPTQNQFFQILTCQTACNGQFFQING